MAADDPDDLAPLVIVIGGDLASSPLPWDIEQASAAVAAVKLPGPPAVRAALATLDDDEASRAITAVAAAADRRGRRAAPCCHRRRRQRIAVVARRSAASCRSARRPASTVGSAGGAGAAVGCRAGRGVAPRRPARHRWAASRRGSATCRVRVTTGPPTSSSASAEIAQLFAVGMLEPVAAGRPVDAWASVGVRRPSAEERARQLLADAPTEPPTDLAGWCEVATWWGDVRRLTAAAPSELRDQRVGVCGPSSTAAFLPWLRSRYGTLLSSAAKWPTTVHRVAHFLARRLRDGDADRVLLVVLDGLGHAQWAHLRERLALEVVESGSTLALVPTYTTVSRQAIFAGDLPSSFPDTLWTTQPEPRRWRELWTQEGFAVTGAAYHRVKGRLPHDHLGFGDAPVNGVVVNAVDDLMHTSELFGDAQLLANLDVWADNGFLVDLVAARHGRRASRRGSRPTTATSSASAAARSPKASPSSRAASACCATRTARSGTRPPPRASCGTTSPACRRQPSRCSSPPVAARSRTTESASATAA